MKQNLLVLLVLFMVANTVQAGIKRVEVMVYLEDGSTVEGLMDINPYKPWTYQKSISIFDKSLKDEKKIKNKQKTKYKAKEIKGYESEGRYFESKKVSLAGRGESESSMKALPAYALIERLVEGSISVYMGYGYPPNVAAGITFDEIYEDIRNNPQYFLANDSNGKAKSMHNINIEKWIVDAPNTSQKFADGEYGNFKRKEKGKLMNFMKGQMENEDPELIIRIVKAYNAEMGK